MKTKYVVLTSALLISAFSFAQKDQLKAAEKALKKGNIDEVTSNLNQAESLITNASDEEKAQYYFLRETVYMDSVDKNIDVDKNLSLAAKAAKEVIAIEQKSGKSKYTPETLKTIVKIKDKLINEAIADSKEQKFKEGANKLYEAYLLDKKDTLNLYYASSFQLNAKDYNAALESLQELRALGFTGKSKTFVATSVISDKEESFATKAERDSRVKLKTHIKPRVEVVPSKEGEISKNIVLILIQQKKIEEAKQVIAEAKILNPDDHELVLTEANLYLETKDFDKYKKLISQVLEKNPNSADLVFNLGVISANAKNTADAEKYYARAIEINPKYVNAYINMAALKLEAERPIIEEMNKLGTSDKDMKRYAVLKTQRQNIFKGVIPFLEKALEVDPNNEDVAKTLINVYSALEMSAEKKALQAKMKM